MNNNEYSNYLKCICGIALGVFLVTNALHLNAYAKPERVSISPSCGPKSGFGVSVKARASNLTVLSRGSWWILTEMHR